jgi:hypothetical protein
MVIRYAMRHLANPRQKAQLARRGGGGSMRRARHDHRSCHIQWTRHMPIWNCHSHSCHLCHTVTSLRTVTTPWSCHSGAAPGFKGSARKLKNPFLVRAVNSFLNFSAPSHTHKLSQYSRVFAHRKCSCFASRSQTRSSSPIELRVLVSLSNKCALE